MVERDHRAVLTWVGVGEQRTDGEEDLGDGERRAPLLLENVQADLTTAVNVAVIDPRAEGHLRGRASEHERQTWWRVAQRVV